MQYKPTKNKNPQVAAKFKKIDKQMDGLLNQKDTVELNRITRQRYVPSMATFPTIETIELRFNK